MDFVNDPRRAELEKMHLVMQAWADFWRDKPRYGVSITYIAMCSIRAQHFCLKEFFDPKNPRRGLTLGLPTRVPRAVNAIVAEKVRKLIHTPDLWRFHERERRILVTYYLKVRPAEPIGAIAKKLDCKPWQVERLVKDSLYYLSTIWRD